MAEHWCKEHSTVWFKKGNMKGFAHPVLDADGEPTGKWCNETKEKPPPVEEFPAEMSKVYWAEKDKTTRKSIERQTSLNAAIELAKMYSAVKPDIKTEQIIAVAKQFEAYLEGKEVSSARGKLVEEAKKQGAVEIMEKED